MYLLKALWHDESGAAMADYAIMAAAVALPMLAIGAAVSTTCGTTLTSTTTGMTGLGQSPP